MSVNRQLQSIHELTKDRLEEVWISDKTARPSNPETNGYRDEEDV